MFCKPQGDPGRERNGFLHLDKIKLLEFNPWQMQKKEILGKGKLNSNIGKQPGAYSLNEMSLVFAAFVLWALLGRHH